MAKASAPFQIQGKVQNLIFKKVNGKQTVQMAPFNTKEKHKKRMKHPRLYKAYRANILEFAGAAAIAGELHRAIRPSRNSDIGIILRPYTQNLLTARLKKYAEHGTKQQCLRHYARSISIADGVKALKDLDLSHKDAPSQWVKMVPMGPQHNPTSIKILGLEQAAEAIGCHGNARLELRFQIRQTAFNERAMFPDSNDWTTWEQAHKLPAKESNAKKHDHSRPSGWIPAEIIPQNGFTLDLPEWPEGSKYTTTILIEWRELRTVGRRTVRHHEKGIARIVSVHAPAESWAPANGWPPHSHSHSHCHQLLPTKIANGTLKAPINWRKSPEAYIKEALANLRPK